MYVILLINLIESLYYIGKFSVKNLSKKKVYDKKTSCIDLMCELDFDGKEQFKKIINSTIKVNNKQAQSTPQNLSDQNVRSMSNSSKQQTYTNSAYLTTTTPKISTSSSSSSFKTFTSTNNHNLNKNHSTKKSLILDSNKNYFNKNKNNTNKPINGKKLRIKIIIAYI